MCSCSVYAAKSRIRKYKIKANGSDSKRCERKKREEKEIKDQLSIELAELLFRQQCHAIEKHSVAIFFCLALPCRARPACPVRFSYSLLWSTTFIWLNGNWCCLLYGFYVSCHTLCTVAVCCRPLNSTENSILEMVFESVNFARMAFSPIAFCTWTRATKWNKRKTVWVWFISWCLAFLFIAFVSSPSAPPSLSLFLHSEKYYAGIDKTKTVNHTHTHCTVHLT